MMAAWSSHHQPQDPLWRFLNLCSCGIVVSAKKKGEKGLPIDVHHPTIPPWCSLSVTETFFCSSGDDSGSFESSWKQLRPVESRSHNSKVRRFFGPTWSNGPTLYAGRLDPSSSCTKRRKDVANRQHHSQLRHYLCPSILSVLFEQPKSSLKSSLQCWIPEVTRIKTALNHYRQWQRLHGVGQGMH